MAPERSARRRRGTEQSQPGPRVVYVGPIKDEPRAIKRMMLGALDRADPKGSQFGLLRAAITTGVRPSSDHAGLLAEIEGLLPHVESMHFGLMGSENGEPVLHVPVRIVMKTEGAGWQFRLLSDLERSLPPGKYMLWSLKGVADNLKKILGGSPSQPQPAVSKR